MLLNIIELFSFIYLFIRYKNAKNKNYNFFSNPFLYFFILSIFYIIIPAEIYYSNLYKLVELKENYVNDVYIYSVYYFFIFFIFYFFSKDPKNNITIHLESNLSNLGFKIIYIFITLLTIILSVIIFINTRNIVNTDSRVDKYNTYSYIQSIPSFTFLSWLIIIWSLFISILKKSIYYLLFLSPLIYLEFVCSSRYYIFLFIIDLYLYNFFITKYKLNLLKISFPILLLFLIGFMREPTSDNSFNLLNFYARTFGEFINTWSTLPLVVNNNYHFDGSLIITFLSFIIPQPFSSLLLGEKLIYTSKITSLHELNIGLGSSIITEGYVYGTYFIYLYPFIICFLINLYYKKISKLQIDGVIIYLFIFINMFAIFRGSGITNFATSLMLFFLLYIIPKEILKHFRLFYNNARV